MRSLLTVLAALCLGASALAADHPVLDRIAADRDAGLLSEADALVRSLQFVFARGELPERYDVADAPPLTCATPLLIEAEDLRPRLTADERRRVDALIARPRADKISRTYVSPSGRFRLSYETSGPTEVPDEDLVPINGVPDFVENCAAYLDSSWTALIDVHGFTPPPIEPGGYYEVAFTDMDALGLTRSTGLASTEIDILHDYRGLAWTQQYPDVTPDDIARMVCAHEFKHASQRAQSGWSEKEWVELDATWSQDVVFDEQNDYRRYLNGDTVGPSCLSHPHIPLDDVTDVVAGLYEEMLWQLWMSETWGVAFVSDVWERRSELPGENMLATYDAVLRAYGSSLEQGFPVFAAWNFLTKHRAVPGLGYRDAADYPAAPFEAVAGYPAIRNGAVDHLSSDIVYLAGLAPDGWLTLEFEGPSERPIGYAVDVLREDGGGHIYPVTPDADGDATFTVPVPLAEIDNVGVIIANPSTDAAHDGTGWRLSMTQRTPPPLAVDVDSLAFALDAGSRRTATVTLSVPADAADLEWSAAIAATDAKSGWLSVAPSSGVVAAGGAVVLELTADAANLGAGRHEAFLLVSYGLPDAPATDVFLKRLTAAADVTVPGGVAVVEVTPVPSRDAVTVRWAGTKADESVDVEVYDLRGRMLAEARGLTGEDAWTWDGRDRDGRLLPSGRYLIRVAAPSGAATAKAVLIR